MDPSFRRNKSSLPRPTNSLRQAPSRLPLTSRTAPSGKDVQSDVPAISGGIANLQIDRAKSRGTERKRHSRPALSERAVESLCKVQPDDANLPLKHTSRRRSSFSTPEESTASNGAANTHQQHKDGNANIAQLQSEIASPSKHSVPPSTEKGMPLGESSQFKDARTITKTSGTNSMCSSMKQKANNKKSDHTNPVNEESRIASGRNPTKHIEGRSKTGSSRPTKGSPVPKIDRPRQINTQLGDMDAAQAVKPTKAKSSLREIMARGRAANQNFATGPDNIDSLASQERLGPCGPRSIQKRLALARKSGKLDLAALELERLPQEIYRMYDLDQIDDESSWAECVDLVRLNVADNEIGMIEESFFPSRRAQLDSDHNHFPDHDDDLESLDCPLSALEMLDAHGNRLSQLPRNMGHLAYLSVLNLARNKLGADCLTVCAGLNNLRELVLADNDIAGVLNFSEVSPSPWEATKVECLDLSKNKITNIDCLLAVLGSSLKVLKMSDNAITQLPNELKHTSCLQELDLARNRIRASVTMPQNLANLKSLDLSSNAIPSIEDPIPLLSSLQKLSLSDNRLQAYPELSMCPRLATVFLDGNQLNAVPDKYFNLQCLKDLNLARNNIRRIDPRFGSMPEIMKLDFSQNPIQDQRLLRLNTQDLLQELRNRLEPVCADESEIIEGEGSMTIKRKSETSCSVSMSSTDFEIDSTGHLDLSKKDLSHLDNDKIAIVADRVKKLNLSQNLCSTFPAEINKLAATLVTLDLSSNRLKGDTYMHERLNLPSLQNLSLSANNITSLDTLIKNLRAPDLRVLDVRRNTLGNLPCLRASFAKLKSLLAADNKIRAVDAKTICGLEVVDLTNNEIAALDPEIGMLQTKGLQSFLVGANLFRVPRRDVVEKGTEALLTWLRSRIPSNDVQSM